MIFWFSGTGNSRYVAERIAKITGDSLINLNSKIRNGDYSEVSCSAKIIFVTPTYAWRIPRVVSDWIAATPFKDAGKAWFVMTCGGEIGNAAKYNKKLCDEKGFKYMGTAQILMPENYIAMFNAPEWNEAENIIAKAEPDIIRSGNAIKNSEVLSIPRNNAYDKFMSSAVNPVFYKMFVKADPFYAKDSCTGCGKCAELCPLNNIRITNGRPVWGRNCTHCMACICCCPAKAIEYGNKSEGKPRYQCNL